MPPKPDPPPARDHANEPRHESIEQPSAKPDPDDARDDHESDDPVTPRESDPSVNSTRV
jgi:hypothetical protein